MTRRRPGQAMRRQFIPWHVRRRTRLLYGQGKDWLLRRVLIPLHLPLLSKRQHTICKAFGVSTTAYRLRCIGGVTVHTEPIPATPEQARQWRTWNKPRISVVNGGWRLHFPKYDDLDNGPLILEAPTLHSAMEFVRNIA